MNGVLINNSTLLFYIIIQEKDEIIMAHHRHHHEIGSNVPDRRHSTWFHRTHTTRKRIKKQKNRIRMLRVAKTRMDLMG